MNFTPSCGWIGPEGQWRPCRSNDHANEAGRICDEILGLEYPYFSEKELEKRGWIRISEPCTGFVDDYPWMVQYRGAHKPSSKALDILYSFVIYFEKLGKTEDANIFHERYKMLIGESPTRRVIPIKSQRIIYCKPTSDMTMFTANDTE